MALFRRLKFYRKNGFLFGNYIIDRKSVEDYSFKM